LRYSISGVLNSNLFGIPMVGADTCGFIGDTTEELCARWIMLSALAYPFSRNHADIHSAPQELYRWPSVARAARKSLDMRLQLVPYMYAQFYRVHRSGGTVVRPLFFEFPSVTETWKISTQLMVGASVLVSPVLDENADSVSAFFPEGLWWNPFTQETLFVETAGYRTLEASTEDIPVHFRGGAVLPMFAPGAMSVAEARASAVSLVAVLDRPLAENSTGTLRAAAPSRAEGSIYLDDGEEPDLENAKATEVFFSLSADASGGGLLATVVRADNLEASKLPYSSLTVVGVPTVAAVEVNGAPLDEASWSHRDGTLQVSCDVCRASLEQALLLAWSSEIAQATH
jgi:alpha-glucosidase (family GH31 glycosyl hydrolase)